MRRRDVTTRRLSGEPAGTSRVAPVLVFAVGNPSRGDDALGPMLIARLREHLAADGGDDVELIEDFQLQIEHCLDLQGRACVIFVDAGTGTPAPYRFERAFPAASPGAQTHALTPAALLAVYDRALGGAPPPAWVLCVRGEQFELGDGLSEAGWANLEAAWTRLWEAIENARAGEPPRFELGAPAS